MLITRVDTGERSEYLFRLTAGQAISVETVQRGKDDRFANYYTDFDAKGKTAVRRLAESHAQLRRFFDAAKALSVYDNHGRFMRFIEPDEASTDEESAALEQITEIMEEVADFEGLEG